MGVKVETPGFLAEICEWCCAQLALLCFFTISRFGEKPLDCPSQPKHLLSPKFQMTSSPLPLVHSFIRSFLHTSRLSVVSAFCAAVRRAACFCFGPAAYLHIAVPLYACIRCTAVVEESLSLSDKFSPIYLFAVVEAGTEGVPVGTDIGTIVHSEEDIALYQQAQGRLPVVPSRSIEQAAPCYVVEISFLQLPKSARHGINRPLKLHVRRPWQQCSHRRHT